MASLTVPDNIATLWMTITRSLALGGQVITATVGAIYLVLASAGARVLWRRARVTALFLACYLVMVMCWPFSPLRFYWGIWPLLMLLPAAGATALWRSEIVRQQAEWRYALAIGALVLSGEVSAFNARGFASAWWSSNARFHARRVLPQLAWVARSSHVDDVVGSDAEGAVYLYTGRRAVPITTFTAAEYARERSVVEESEIVRQLVDRYEPHYLLATSPKLAEATARAARARVAPLVRIDTIPNGVVYERK